MRYSLFAALAATALLVGCGDTSAVDKIAASQGVTTEKPTKSAAELAEPIHTTAPTTEAVTAPQMSGEQLDPDGEFDIDLTTLSASMVYGQVYDMVYHPEDYLGKTVKMRGPFAYYYDEATGKEYFAVLITDAMACCSQGIEFVLDGEHSYPDDYPELNSEITVIGRFSSYNENNIPYSQLTNAHIIE
ncbi:MAG: hypothetical protein IKG98_05470 [Ruminococcus sp.]|nr:hypothetical protein [Ruminococcus sp.]